MAGEGIRSIEMFGEIGYAHDNDRSGRQQASDITEFLQQLETELAAGLFCSG